MRLRTYDESMGNEARVLPYRTPSSPCSHCLVGVVYIPPFVNLWQSSFHGWNGLPPYLGQSDFWLSPLVLLGCYHG